jgi:hypothetical protein
VDHKIQTALNGHLCVDLNDPDGKLNGITALQLHSGGKMEIHIKPIELEINPEPRLKSVK